FNRFAEVISGLDESVARFGFPEASRQLLPRFIKNTETVGQEHIPHDGPVLIISNHPGTLDGLLIASRLHRSDLKIVVTAYPFYQALSKLKDNFIFTTNAWNDKVSAIRQSVRQLQDGGALLIFPRGILEPDPAVMAGAETTISEWSPSIELFLRKVPETRLVTTIVSGLIAPSSLRNPIVRLGRNPAERQTVAEIFQMIRHIYMPRSLRVSPKLTFDAPRSARELFEQFGKRGVMQEIVHSAQQLLSAHLQSFSPQLDKAQPPDPNRGARTG
ncbi:MAG: 1-acyl-sn-glycerol-3-phosphate acyltransferase, partial [Anaerolineales bacterium]